MPDTPADLRDLLRDSASIGGDVCAYLEKVGGHVRGNPLPGSAMFSFGRGYGHVEMALLCLGVPRRDVKPEAWQKYHTIGTRGSDSAAQWKRRLKEKAQQLYPHLKVTLATADALLMLSYALSLEMKQ